MGLIEVPFIYSAAVSILVLCRNIKNLDQPVPLKTLFPRPNINPILIENNQLDFTELEGSQPLELGD